MLFYSLYLLESRIKELAVFQLLNLNPPLSLRPVREHGREFIPQVSKKGGRGLDIAQHPKYSRHHVRYWREADRHLEDA